MKDMSIPYEETGRTRQKARTREAMLAAARALLGEGVTPTVEQAADRAAVSRTTAYRYFPNQQALLLACYPQLETQSLLSAQSSADPLQRVQLVIDDIGRQLLEHEPELRANLRLSLEHPRPDPDAIPLRRGRAIAWIEDALSPLRDRMKKAELHQLALAIRAAFGIEPLVWLTDVGGVSREDAIELMRSSALTLLRAALAGVARPRARPRDRKRAARAASRR
jgi:AcrR family transcriptional regulator